MQVPLEEEQTAFASVVARMVEDHRSDAPRPQPGTSGPVVDERLWDDLCRGGYVEGVAPGAGDPVLLGLLGEEVGRWLAPLPLVGSVVAAGAALGAAAPDHGLTADVLAGTERAALCCGPDLAVREDGESFVVDGSAVSIEGLLQAQHLVVGTEEGLFLVDPESPGVVRRADALDLTRDVGDVQLTGVAAVRLSAPGGTGPALRAALDLARLVRACEAVGAAQRCLALTVEHLAMREQFGRPIGTFQALQHRCAVIEVQNTAALSAVRRACRAAAAGDPSLSLQISVAAVSAGQALEQAASGAVQMHGGMGFTWEHDAHLYLRRSRSDVNRPDSTAQHLDTIADALLASAASP